MMNPEVESHIKNNFAWSNLPGNVKQTLGNNEKNWHKCVSDYCIKNQYRYKNSIVKQVRKDEKKYYQELIQYSRDNLMLYPYHLADIVVKGLRLTPFGYYCNMMQDIMASEKSYDSLPNFTAADCLRLMGIGRNQYIEIMNQCKSSKRFFRARRPPRELLPMKPIPQTVIRSWWITHPGYITDDDVKMCTPKEVKTIDQLIDEGPRAVKEIDDIVIGSLYNKGLIYFDIPIQDKDHIVVPPLENFVMNRVLGDYMETMLYKVFVSIDEVTSVEELGQVLEIDLLLIKNAISLFCRLGLAQRKGTADEKDSDTNRSLLSDTKTRNFGSVPNLLDLDDFSDKENGVVTPSNNSAAEMLIDSDSSGLLSPDNVATNKRIAFLFDSTLTAFLMMGNLSQGLKRHAVTMFEVGKLSDETMENFISELEKIEAVGNEGEAQRYFDHAVVLKKTIQFIRNNVEISFDQDDSAPGLDLVRCESMNSLDPSVCAKILMKKYSLLVSMAPLSNEIRPISSCTPPHIGPAVPEVNSMWFKLFLYSKVKNGPPSLLLVKGTRLRKLPKMFMGYDRLMITTWGHDPAVVPTSNVLFSLNDALTHSPVLVQAHGWFCEGEVQSVGFPFDEKYITESSESPYAETLKAVNKAFALTCTCGYLTLINLTSKKNMKTRRGMNDMNLESVVGSDSEVEGVLSEASSSSDELLVKKLDLEKSKSVSSLENSYSSCNSDVSNLWVPLHLCYGIPLFDGQLNEEITKKIISCGICKKDNLATMTNSNRMLSLELLDFITEWQEKVIIPSSTSDVSSQSIAHPSKSILFNNGVLSLW